MKLIGYMMPVDYMRGNLSGRQFLEYGDGKTAYEAIEAGSRGSAANYQPRLVARVVRLDRPTMLRNFQVRTRHSVNMSATMRLNLALMGGVGAIFAAVVSDKTSAIYNDCVQACPKGMTLRGWMSPIIRQGLAAKNSTLAIADGIAIQNPWISGGTGSPVTIPQSVLDKFASELSNS